ncbi:hypothetical protein HY626_00280 [Candidatus Uhrbacteria bacterium]|nr:hypothetical protein [Candidatus Uhrbacteria bacterium]
MTQQPILDMDLAALRRLRRTQSSRLTPEEIRHIFETCSALWLHSGDMTRPHAELTSGRCSNGFVDVLRVLRYANLCELLGRQLAVKIDDAYRGRVDWVVGSDHAAATLSFAVASFNGAQHDFTEKGSDKIQLWKRFEIGRDEVVLQVEELVTTTGTLQAVRDGLRRAHDHEVQFAPVVACLVHRAPTHEFEGSPIVSLIHFDIQTWAPEECPLCAAGSPRVRPKHNWVELTG